MNNEYDILLITTTGIENYLAPKTSHININIK